MTKLIEGSIAIVATILVFSSAASATEIVLVCKLVTERETHLNPTNSQLLAEPKPIQKEFVMKFDDTIKRVTYIGGEAIIVKYLPDFQSRFENEIVFVGDSSTALDGLTMRYSGSVDRLTGRIRLYTVWLGGDGHAMEDRWHIGTEQTGNCTGGTRKF